MTLRKKALKRKTLRKRQ